MAKKTFVCLALTSRNETASWDFAKKVLSVLHDGDARLCPERAGHNESFKRRASPITGLDDLLPLWTPTPHGAAEGRPYLPDLFWKRTTGMRAEGSFGQSWINLVEQMIPANAWFRCDFVGDFDYVAVFTEWCRLYRPTQGYLHLFTDPEVLESSAKLDGSGGEFGLGGSWQRFRTGGFGADRDQKTYNLGFLNYFPRDRFAPRVWEDLAAGGIDLTPFVDGYLIQLAPSLQAIKQDFGSFARRRIWAKQIIGKREFVIEDEPPPQS